MLYPAWPGCLTHLLRHRPAATLTAIYIKEYRKDVILNSLFISAARYEYTIMDCRTNELSYQWTVGPMDSRINGLSDQRGHPAPATEKVKFSNLFDI